MNLAQLQRDMKLRVHNFEKRALYSEVLTPYSLCIEMVTRLYEFHPEAFSPEKKWLEPSAGDGSLFKVVYCVLDVVLSTRNEFSDASKRQHHILNNMLYLVELEDNNVRTCREFFPNVYHGSFLDYNENNFDVVIGNPPFNAKRTGTKGTTAGRTHIWEKFVVKGLSLLNPGGVLDFLTPCAWRGVGKASKLLWDVMRNWDITYIHIFNKKDGRKFFRASTRFDVYILCKRLSLHNTFVVDEHGNEHCIDLSKWPFLPNCNYALFNNILCGSNGIEVYHSSVHRSSGKNTSRVKDSVYQYPVVHSINRNGVQPLLYAREKNGHIGYPKVLLSLNEKQYTHTVQNDYKGEMGMTELVYGIPIKSQNEGKYILRCMNTKMFKDIVKSTKWTSFQTDFKMFKYFRKDMWDYILHSST